MDQASHEDVKVIVLGSNVPEELLLASGAAYYWMLGGSPRTGFWISDIVPRDADAVSRSMLRFLNNDIGAFSKGALILIPAVSDNNRKLAYMLRQDTKYIPLTFRRLRINGRRENGFGNGKAAGKFCRRTQKGRFPPMRLDVPLAVCPIAGNRCAIS